MATEKITEIDMNTSDMWLALEKFRKVAAKTMGNPLPKLSSVLSSIAVCLCQRADCSQRKKRGLKVMDHGKSDRP